MNQLSDLAQQLHNFHDAEYLAQLHSAKQTWALPLSVRVGKGSAIDKVKITVSSNPLFRSALAVRNCISIEYEKNNSSFRPGSQVLLHRGNPFDQENSYALEVSREFKNGMILDASYGRNPSGQNTEGWILDANAPDFRWILQKALDALPTAPTDGALADILIYKAPPTFNSAASATALALSLGLGLNKRQQEAFINAYAAENYYLIQGPPGTGKTWVLAQLAAAFARAGQRVLVTSSNHLGINNALAKIHQATSYPHTIKIGRADQAEGLAHIPNYEHCPDLTQVNGQAFIVGGTVQALYTRRLANTRFDVIIADEASQLNLVQAAGVLLAGTKFVFIGDHQQMPPIITAEHPNTEHRQSIFEYLFRFAPGTMLNTTYRLNTALADFSSHQFYGGQLQAHPLAATRTLQLPTAPTHYAEVLDPSQPSVFVDLRHANTKTHELNEAYYIADMIAELLASGVPATEIAVVAPYRAQGRIIRRYLEKRCPDHPTAELAQITIDTVERMQGQERDVVFLSLTSGRFDAALQRATFYFMPNRLNVAITRARVKRIVVGSSRLTQASFESPELQQWADSFGQFLNSCHRITRFGPLKQNKSAAV